MQTGTSKARGPSGHEAEVDGRRELPIGVCQFHRLDNAGSRTDREFPSTLVYDRLLRLVRHCFGFGAGLVVLHAVATEFERLACELDKQACDHMTFAAKADTEGWDGTAQGLRQASDKTKTFRRAGWTTFRRPRAPKADGTRKVVWQSGARQRLFDRVCLGMLGDQGPNV